MAKQSSIDMVLELRNQGYTLQKIANICGRSLSWVYKIVKSVDVVPPDRESVLPDDSSKQVDEDIMNILEMKE
jgi:transposase